MNNDRKTILRYLYDRRVEPFIFTHDIDNTIGLNREALLVETSYLAEKGYIEIKSKVLSGDMLIRITAFGVDEVEREDHNATIKSEADSAKHAQSVASVDSDIIHIKIRDEIYNHIKRYLDTEDYFHAVEEAYKVVREKLREITGKEAATDVFNMNAESNKYHEQIFGETAVAGTAKNDFFRGVGYLNLSIQFLRNEKAHSLAANMDKNLTIHYISLASLAYDLITRAEN